MKLTRRFNDALLYALNLHANQLRKGTSTPYAVHLLVVSALVLEYGGDEDQAIAALLHDAVEDQGGRQRLIEIENRFGNRVSEIVKACTDSWETPKPPWRARKEAYLEHLQGIPDEAKLVSCADKIHNGRAIVRDAHSAGDNVWNRFKGGEDGTVWYYRSILNILQESYEHPIVNELAEVVNQLLTLADQTAELDR